MGGKSLHVNLNHPFFVNYLFQNDISNKNNMQLILKHNTTNFKHYYDWVVVEETTPLHTQINLNLSKLEDGEYTLTLFNDTGMPLAEELVRIGDYQIKDYKTTKQFKHYARK